MTYIHETAILDPGAEIGENTKIWHFTHIMSKAKIGELDSAIRDLQKSIDLDPTSSTAQHNLGVMLSKSLRKEEALTHFEMALVLYSEYFKAANNLAKTAK